MIKFILDIFANALSAIIPNLLKKKEPSEYKKSYEELRREISEALSMYACYFHNPIDLADTPDHKLPPLWQEGSYKIRFLAS